MDYKRIENTIVIRMDKDEEIIETLKKVCLKENVKLASLSAIGAIKQFKIGVYDVEKKQYFSKDYSGTYEIVSLLGNISTMNDEYYSHLHISCSSFDGNVIGGHLNSGIVSATVEMFLSVIDGRVDRKVDPVTGLNIFDFDK